MQGEPYPEEMEYQNFAIGRELSQRLKGIAKDNGNIDNSKMSLQMLAEGGEQDDDPENIRRLLNPTDEEVK